LVGHSQFARTAGAKVLRGLRYRQRLIQLAGVTLPGAVLVLSGCTTNLQVSQVNPNDSRTRVGAPYSLPFTQYEIAIDREVIGCGTELKIKTTAEIRSSLTRPDPDARFAINPSSLSSPLKTSEIKLEYDPNGIATSLNATAEDRSAQIISNVVGSIAKVVSIAGIAGREEGTFVDICSLDVLAARGAIGQQRPKVKAATKLVEERTAELKTLQTKAMSLGSNVDPQTKVRLSRAYDALAAATDDLSEKTEALAMSMKVIRHTQVIRWPERGTDRSGIASMPVAVLKRWTAVTSGHAAMLAGSDVHLELSALTSAGQAPSSQPIDPRLGIPFRRPEPGRLQVCAGEPCSPNAEPIAQKVSDIPQLGMVYYLPCQSRPFSSIACNFTMASDGSIKTIGSAQKAATAEGASGAALATLAAAEGIATNLSTANQKKLEARTAILKAEAEYNAALAAVTPHANADVAAATAAAKANVELYQARKAEWDARAALEQLQATGGGVAP
jgi:hypothetical protein